MSLLDKKTESNKDRKAASRASLLPWKQSRKKIAENVKRPNMKGKKNHI